MGIMVAVAQVRTMAYLRKGIEGVFILYSEYSAAAAIRTRGIVFETVYLCAEIFWSVLRGSRESSRRCKAAVTARTAGVRRCEGDVGMLVGMGRLSIRKARMMGENIMRGTEADGPEEVRTFIGRDMVMYELLEIACD
jgi:hypothetical protein